MARGYPDFFGQPTFPGYGTATCPAAGSVVCLPGEVKTVINILGKGRILDCVIRANSAVRMANQEISIYIDGNWVCRFPPNAALDSPLFDYEFLIVKPIAIFHETGYWYWRIPADIIFNSQLRIDATNADALTNLQVKLRLAYNNVA